MANVAGAAASVVSHATTVPVAPVWPLPAPWQEHTATESKMGSGKVGMKYYHNSVTGVTQWERPVSAQEREDAAARALVSAQERADAAARAHESQAIAVLEEITLLADPWADRLTAAPTQAPSEHVPFAGSLSKDGSGTLTEAASCLLTGDIAGPIFFAAMEAAALEGTEVEIAVEGKPGEVEWSNPPVCCKVLAIVAAAGATTCDVKLTRPADRAGEEIENVAAWHLQSVLGKHMHWPRFPVAKFCHLTNASPTVWHVAFHVGVLCSCSTTLRRLQLYPRASVRHVEDPGCSTGSPNCFGCCKQPRWFEG